VALWERDGAHPVLTTLDHVDYTALPLAV